MFKKSLVVLALLQSTYSLADESKAPKYLHWEMNDQVVVTISNMECPLPRIKSEYPFASVAKRIDGQRIMGCYKKLDENYIEISWHLGDKSILPANAFLQKTLFDN